MSGSHARKQLLQYLCLQNCFVLVQVNIQLSHMLTWYICGLPQWASNGSCAIKIFEINISPVAIKSGAHAWNSDTVLGLQNVSSANRPQWDL